MLCCAGNLLSNKNFIIMGKLKFFGVGILKAILFMVAGYVVLRAWGSKMGGVDKTLDGLSSSLPGADKTTV